MLLLWTGSTLRAGHHLHRRVSLGSESLLSARPLKQLNAFIAWAITREASAIFSGAALLDHQQRDRRATIDSKTVRIGSSVVQPAGAQYRRRARPVW